jgi:AcrR family transcriptional regulator
LVGVGIYNGIFSTYQWTDAFLNRPLPPPTGRCRATVLDRAAAGEIVAAALRLARESSPALITSGDIAAAIGVTQGAVFKHFRKAHRLAAALGAHDAA